MKKTLVALVVLSTVIGCGTTLAATLSVTNDLVLWLDASDVDGAGNNPGAGASVSDWANKAPGSPVGNAVTATEEGGDAPLYVTNAGAWYNNQPALWFDGDSSGLKVADNAALDATTGLTVFMVADRQDGFRFMQKGNGTGTGSGDWFTSPTSGMGVAGTWQSPPYTVDNTPHVFESLYDPSSGTNGGILNLLDGALRGGELSLASAYSSPNSADLFIGRRYNPALGGTQGFLDGHIAEVLVYNNVLTESERQEVGWYLQTKYGIAGSYVPEPSTALMVLLAAFHVLLLRRRSRRSMS